MIKLNIQMPQRCDDCFALDDNGDYPTCRITHTSRGYTFNTREKRMPDCPLNDMSKKKVVHFHQEFPDHDWARDEDGKIDEFAMEYEYHNGPYCNRCGYSFCIHCTPNGWNATRCIVDYNTCPTCGGRVVRSQHFCDRCGQELDWE